MTPTATRTQERSTQKPWKSKTKKYMSVVGKNTPQDPTQKHLPESLWDENVEVTDYPDGQSGIYFKKGLEGEALQIFSKMLVPEDL